jgi:hypothetical protein
MHGSLSDRYYRRNPGGGRAAAEREAAGALERLVRAALTDVGERFVAEKDSILGKILTVRREIHDSLGAILEKEGKAATPEAIGQKLKDLRQLLKDVRERPEDTAAKKGATPELDGERPEETAGKKGPTPELDAERRKVAEELAPTPKPTGAKAPVAAGAKRLTGKGFRWVEGVKAWVKRYATGRLEFTIEDGVFKVRSYAKGATTPEVFSEFDTLDKPYRDKPLSSRVMQAHHGLQDALMEKVFGKYGYDGGEAPTMWLRNSTGESPHGRITHELQNPNQASRMKDPDMSYAKIRELGVADLKSIGAPPEKIEAYLKAIDKHFREKILPKIDAAVQRGKLTPEAASALVGGKIFQ